VGDGGSGSSGGESGSGCGAVGAAPPPPPPPLLVPALDARARSSCCPLDPISLFPGLAFSAPPRNPWIFPLLPSLPVKFVYRSSLGTGLKRIYTTGMYTRVP
jgi:hypothetical protein